MKICRKCQEEKHESGFYAVKQNKDGLASYCRKCMTAATTARRQTAEGRVKYNEQAKVIQRVAKLRRHGVADELIPVILLEQENGSCHACERSTSVVGRLHVDHDHQTNEYRGLLCKPCNTSLGLVGDSIERLCKLAAYLTPSLNDLELMR